MTLLGLAEKTNLDKAVIKNIFDIIKEEVIAGNEVDIYGFGKFTQSTRSARLGRNPKTGEPMQISAKKCVKFKPSKTFKDALN